MTDARSIHDRIVAITDALPAIGKDQVMSGGGVRYNYRGIEDLLPHFKGLFTAHGVYVTPEHALISDESYDVPKKGGGSTRWRHVTILSDFTFHGLDGDEVRVTVLGEGKDSADKAVLKAMTSAYKYALIQTFCVADASDDPDREAVPRESGAVTPMAPAEPTPLQVLVAMRDDLMTAGLYDEVVAFAADNEVELVPGAPADRVQAVVARAAQLLAEHRQMDEAEPPTEG